MVVTPSVRALLCPAPSLPSFHTHKCGKIFLLNLRQARTGKFDSCTIRNSHTARQKNVHRIVSRPSLTYATKDGEPDEIDVEEFGLIAGAEMDRGAPLAPVGGQQEVWVVRVAVDALTQGLRWLGVQNRWPSF